MKRIIIILFLIVQPIYPIWVIQHTNIVTSSACGTTPGSSTAITITSTTSGRALIVSLTSNSATANLTVASWENNGSTSAYTDTTAVGRCTVCGGSAYIVYQPNIAGSITSVTPVCSASVTLNGVILEVSGIPTSSILDTSALLSNQTATGTNPFSPALTTAASGEFIVAVVTPAQTITGIHAGNEFTSDSVVGGNGYAHITSTSATAASHQAEWDDNTSADLYATSIAAFKITGSAAAAPSRLTLLGVGFYIWPLVQLHW